MRPSHDQIKPMQLLYLIPSPAPNDHMADSSHTYNSIKGYFTRIINSYEWKFHNFDMLQLTTNQMACSWLVGWLCWGLTSQSTIFQSYRDGAIASWVINQYFRGVKCLAQGHNTAAVGLEPRTSRSGVRHSTTEPPRSPKWLAVTDCFEIIAYYWSYYRMRINYFRKLKQ